MADIAGAMLSTSPSTKGAIRDTIAAGPGGIGSQLEGITQQIQGLQRARAASQSQIFSAVDPMGNPVDPRIKVAQFQSSQKAMTDQENTLRQLEDMYNAQLGALTDSEYNRQAAENEKNKVAMSYLKDIEDRKLQQEKLALDTKQFNAKMSQDQSQFDQTMGLNRSKMSEDQRQFNIKEGVQTVLAPNKLLDAEPGTLIPTRLSQVTNPNGGKECAEYVNDITGAGLGSTFQSKLKVAKESQGSIGAIAVWQPSKDPKYAQYGHAGIIIGEDENRWLIKSSNYKVDGKVSEDWIPKDKIQGYKNNAVPTKQMKVGTKEDKPKTFNEFIENIDIPETDKEGKPLTEADIKGLIDVIARDYPTESVDKIGQALINRS